MRHLLASVLLVCTAAAADGPTRPLQDPLLERMVGRWRLAGTIQGRPASHDVEVSWVTGHQFLRIHERDVRPDPASKEPPYEAMVFVGYDQPSERYVAHWLDVFGGRSSETLGYGTRDGERIRFVFEYPDGPFQTTFAWSAPDQSWRWQMRSKDKEGRWEDFANTTLTRRTDVALVRKAADAPAKPILGGKATASVVLEPAVTGSGAVSLDVLVFEAGSEVPSHSHAGASETLYLLEGQLALEPAGTTAGPGDTVFIPADAPHAARAVTRTRAVQVYAPAGPEQRFK